jgi:hypothetical protein
LAIFRKRVASTQELVSLFAVGAFPVYVWSILIVLSAVPAWIPRLNTWDLIGAIAYTQVFALIESIIVFLALLLLRIILPTRLVEDKFVALASMLVFMSTILAVRAHNTQEIFGAEHVKQLVFWFATYLVSIGALFVLIYRYQSFERLIRSLANRLVILALVYASVSLASVVVVFLRNI